jgi:alkaline phosphatase D
MEHSFIYKAERPWPNRRLKVAAIVGHTTTNSTRLWLRTAAPGDFEILLYAFDADNGPDGINALLHEIPFKVSKLPSACRRIAFTVASFGSDSTHVEDIDKLRSDTVYRYALLGIDPIGGQKRVLLGQDTPLEFRTFPDDNSTPLELALFSCNKPFKTTIFNNTRLENDAMWEGFNRALGQRGQSQLRFIIGGGDQVYADGVETLDIWKYLNSNMSKSGNTIRPGQDEIVSWYRDIYRGYWGFRSMQQAFARFPTYMIWDDHEIADGWGSHRFDANKPRRDELDKLIPDWKDIGRPAAMTLVKRMENAARQVYAEYEHSRNPQTPDKQWDYSFTCGPAVTYVLDGRGHRDFNRADHKILGATQLTRFRNWIQAVDVAQTPFVFVVSAVPLVHLRPAISAIGRKARFARSAWDDLRDHWEHPAHKDECAAFTEVLFAGAARGLRICVLSGDVHISTAFRLQHKQSGDIIYQLTSSAITYNVGRIGGAMLGLASDDKGETREGHAYKRLALYKDANFSIIRVDPNTGKVEFKLYGRDAVLEMDVDVPGATDLRPEAHPMANIELGF